MELSLISILCPSCRTNKPVPLSLGVLRTVTLGDKTIASFLSSNSLFCSEAKILLNTVNTKNRIPAINPLFFQIICLEKKNRENEISKRIKNTIPNLAQASTLKQFVNDLIQATKNISGTETTLSIVLERAISKLARISALPGCNNKARS